MNRLSIGILVVLLLAQLVSCIEEIPFASGKGSGTLVISGGINNLEEDQTVFLSRTVENAGPSRPEAHAQVKLMESSGRSWNFLETSEGQYTLPAGTADTEFGESYHIECILEGGVRYRSHPEKLLPAVQADSIGWRIGKETTKIEDGYSHTIDALQLFIHTGFAADQPETYLRWTVQSAFQFTTLPECSPFRTTVTCYFSELLNPGRYFIRSNKGQSGEILRNHPIGYESMEPFYRYSETHYFTIYQHRISQRAYEYYSRLNQVAVQNGSIFDPIPASVKGNVYRVDREDEKVLGYFQVSSIAVARLKVVQADLEGKYTLLDKRNNLCGLYFGYPDAGYFEGCCNCFSIKFPLIDKPDWW